MEKRLIDGNALQECVYPMEDKYCDKHYVIDESDLNGAETVLTIPENPTNGDMIKALFPQLTHEANTEYFGKISNPNNHDFIKANIDWWNAPYTGLNKPDPDVGRMM